MRELRAVIADDEPLARRGIRQLLAAHADVQVVAECRDGRETVRALQTLAPDLLFLDVQMPEVDGFGVLRAHGASRMPAVIFVTAYDEFAVAAFEAQAIDYLVKPVNEARFAAALTRARDRIASAEAVALTKQLTSLLAMHDAAARGRGGAPEADGRFARRLLVPTSAGDLILDVDEIEWIQAEDYYAAVHARGKRYLIRQSLATLEEQLDPARFIRAHRSAIVNLARVRELRSTMGASTIVLRDGTRVPVSRRRREHVASLLRSSTR